MPDLPWLVYAMLLAPLGLILFAATYKTLQARAVRDWPLTPGKVVISTSEVREVRVIDDRREDGYRLEPRNFANIVYEYRVDGETQRNNRVSIGEDRSNVEIAETIARYPVGTAVIVFYNPRQPREAVLERDLPNGLWRCLGIGTLVALAIVFGSAVGVNQLVGFVAARITHPKLSALVITFAAFGFVIALFALALQRQASLAKNWPVVSGTIEMSDVEHYRTRPEEPSAPGEDMYQRRVSYTYRFNNVAYSNVAASLATGSASTSGWLTRKFRTAYQDGAIVNVYVDPANPAEATLHPRAGFAWILWLVALAFWVGAYLIARAP
jgi:Protein of unknown function (DUF3592)